MTLLKRLRYVDISKYMKQIEFGKFFFFTRTNITIQIIQYFHYQLSYRFRRKQQRSCNGNANKALCSVFPRAGNVTMSTTKGENRDPIIHHHCTQVYSYVRRFGQVFHVKQLFVMHDFVMYVRCANVRTAIPTRSYH